MEDRLGLHIFVKFLALTTISLRTFICLEVYFLPMPPGLEFKKMVKICQTRLLKLNFEIIPKKRIFRFCQKFPQAMHEVEKFFLPISKSLDPYRVSGMGGYTSKCEKKSKSLHPNAQLPI